MSTKCCSDPPTLSAIAMATSLADFVMMILIAESSVIVAPGFRYIFAGGCETACFDIVTGLSSVSLPDLQLVEHHVEQHQLRQRGRVPPLERVVMLEHLSGGDVDEDARESAGARSACRRRSAAQEPRISRKERLGMARGFRSTRASCPDLGSLHKTSYGHPVSILFDRRIAKAATLTDQGSGRNDAGRCKKGTS